MLRLSMRGDSARREYLALLAEEYRTLATSGNQADRHTYTALQWGTAIVGIVASGAISQWGKHDAAVELTFLVAIPALVAVGMLYWVGELARMRRIYDFMCAIEAKAELALRDPAHSTSRRGWFRSFDKRWTTERTTLLADLKLEMPHSDQGTVEITSGPIGFERWLRMIRNTQASSNLSWVFAVRFILFPSSLAASWLTGIYYSFFQSAKNGLGWSSLCEALVGLLLGLITIWLAYELVDDLKESASTETRKQARARTVFRRVIGAPLRITEWQ